MQIIVEPRSLVNQSTKTIHEVTRSQNEATRRALGPGWMRRRFAAPHPFAGLSIIAHGSIEPRRHPGAAQARPATPAKHLAAHRAKFIASLAIKQEET